MQNEENKVKKSFFQGVKTELKKVVWPTARQTAKNTLVTIMFVLLISIILIVFNIVFEFISGKWYDLILGKTNHQNEVVEQVVSGEMVSGESEEEPALSIGTEDVEEEVEEDNSEPVGEASEEIEEAE